MSQFKLAIKDAVEKTRYKWQKKDRGVHVLTFHGLIENREHRRLQRNFDTIDEFYTKVKLLKKGNGVVLSPEEFEAQASDKTLLQHKKAFLLTFDDGYKNNLKAMEILADVGFEAAYFVCAGSLGSNTSIWTVNLSLLLMEGHLDQVEFQNQLLPLRSEDERKTAFNIIRYQLKATAGENRKDEMQKIIHQFPTGELERLMEIHSYFKMLSEAELADASASGQCIQSHGVTHELFHKNQSAEMVFDEMKDSKLALEKMINKPVTWYAYPNGDDAQPLVSDLLKKSGYTFGFSLGDMPLGENFSTSKIPRYNAREHAIKFLF